MTLSPLGWLSVACLDAPIVAISWQELFARSFHSPLGLPARAVLFLTAWLIYLGDRLVDSWTMPSTRARSARHHFYLRHRSAFVAWMIPIAILDATCAWRALDRQTLLAGGIIAAATTGYLAVNHLASSLWRRIPIKEVIIGFLFASGTIAAIHLRGAVFFTAVTLFAILCSLNCLSISVWELPLDLAQARVSFATAHPRLSSIPETASYVLAVAGLSLTFIPTVRPFSLCLASSALAIAMLNRVHGIGGDVRVALADLVMLTPLIVFLA